LRRRDLPAGAKGVAQEEADAQRPHKQSWRSAMSRGAWRRYYILIYCGESYTAVCSFDREWRLAFLYV
jgi:hypothetical protein